MAVRPSAPMTLSLKITLIARFMGPIWGRQDPGGPHVGPMNLAIWVAHWSLGDPYVIIELIIFKFISGVDLLSISCVIVLQDLTGDLSKFITGSGNGLVPSDRMMPYGITRPPQSLRQWHCWALCWIWSGLSDEIRCGQTQFFKIWFSDGFQAYFMYIYIFVAGHSTFWSWVIFCPVFVNAKWPFITVNTMRPRQKGYHFLDDIFKRVFINENVWILITISLKFVPMVKLTIF